MQLAPDGDEDQSLATTAGQAPAITGGEGLSTTASDSSAPGTGNGAVQSGRQGTDARTNSSTSTSTSSSNSDADDVQTQAFKSAVTTTTGGDNSSNNNKHSRRAESPRENESLLTVEQARGPHVAVAVDDYKLDEDALLLLQGDEEAEASGFCAKCCGDAVRVFAWPWQLVFRVTIPTCDRDAFQTWDTVRLVRVAR